MSVINTNLQALQLTAALGRNQDLMSGSMDQLSSGSKIATAGDDPVGVGLANKFSSQNQRLTAATSTIQNAIAYTQTGDGILATVGDILSRLSQLVTLASDPTMSGNGVAGYQQEFQGLQDQLRTIIGGTTAEIGGTADITSPEGNFNGIPFFGPSTSAYQVVMGASVGESMTIPATNLRTGAMLNVIQQDASGAYALNLSTASAADLSDAIQQVAGARASFGAAQVRLDVAAAAIQTQSLNNQSAISQISDTDVATQSTELAKRNVLVQAGTAMLAQANATSEAVLRLLQH